MFIRDILPLVGIAGLRNPTAVLLDTPPTNQKISTDGSSISVTFTGYVSPQTRTFGVAHRTPDGKSGFDPDMGYNVTTLATGTYFSYPSIGCEASFDENNELSMTDDDLKAGSFIGMKEGYPCTPSIPSF